MMQVRNSIFNLVLLAALLSCEEIEHRSEKNEVNIDIYEPILPTQALVNQNVELHLKAQAQNACYSNLKMKLTEGDNKHIVIEATADFQTNGACAEVMVYSDSVINFKPTSPGLYFFQVNQAPFKVRSYTLDVK